MVPIVFDPQQVKQFLAALEHGQPLVPPEGGWTVAEMLMVAGTMHCALMAHIPALNGKAAGLEGVSAEQKEAFAEAYAAELAEAIETCSRLAASCQSAETFCSNKVVGRVMTVNGNPIAEVKPFSRAA